MGRSTNTALAALKIGGRVAYERLARPKARQFDDVPCTPYAVTPEWLTAVLCGKVPGAVVTQVEVKAASAGTHERHQLKVSYNEEGRRAGLPVSIFTKSLPSIVTRMIGGFNGTARVEGSFFTQIRPQLEIEAPLCYHSAYDRRTFAAIHLLEDLVATKSATFCNHKTYVTRAMADDMIDLLASLHGRFYGDPTLAERYRWLASYPRWFTIGAAKMGTEYYTRKAFDDAGEMGLCDWQCLSRGHWTRDFAYAVTASLTPDNRRSWERELLARYIERFAEKTGITPDFDLSFLRYRQQIVHALAMWTITLCHSPLLPNMQPEDTTLTMIERMTTAMADLDALDSFRD